jgi:hypothetical protein
MSKGLQVDLQQVILTFSVVMCIVRIIIADYSQTTFQFTQSCNDLMFLYYTNKIAKIEGSVKIDG